jgi:ATP-dependent DNA helicase RecG
VSNQSQLPLDLLTKKPPALLTADEIFEAISPALLGTLAEDKRIERKPPGYHTKALGEYFSMYANTAPDGGIIVVGMENDGTVTGCSELSPRQLNDLERAGRIYCPDARYETKRIAANRPDGQEDFLLAFRIYYRADKLVRTVSNEAFYRRGESKEQYSAEEAREEEIDRGQTSLELEPCQYIYPDDFDVELVRQFAANFRKMRDLTENITDEGILELRHLGKMENRKFKPNTACALLFAKQVTRDFPGCKIRFLRFDGEIEGIGERWNATKDIWIDEGSVPRQIVEAEKVLDQQVREFTKLGPDQKFYTAPEYPKTAWYEALINACVHRSYELRNMNIFIKMFDDRLEILSPGGFPPTVTPENIYESHHPRNPHFMEAMYYLHFVRCAHEGTRRMRETMIAIGLPKPEFSQKEIDYSQVKVTLRNDIKHRKVYYR